MGVARSGLSRAGRGRRQAAASVTSTEWPHACLSRRTHGHDRPCVTCRRDPCRSPRPMPRTSRKPQSPRGKRRWSQGVTETSEALDLTPGVFGLHDPAAIARSLKASAEHSPRRKASPFRSAMSMLTFYINRGGRNVSRQPLAHLEAAKDSLRALFRAATTPQTPLSQLTGFLPCSPAGQRAGVSIAACPVRRLDDIHHGSAP